MLDGINVLSQKLVSDNFSAWVLIILGVVIGYVGIWLLHRNIRFALGSDYFILITSIVFIIVGITMIGCATYLSVNSEELAVKQYRVTIDESVSLIEFYERYEVVEIDGEIWTIIDKNVD